MTPDLRNRIFGMCKNTNDNTHRHYDQADTKQRVNTSDNLINRNKCCNKIIKKNDPQPELCACDNSCHTTVLKQCNDKSCRSYCENGTYHYKQYNTEYTHDILHHISKVNTTYLRNGCSIISLRKHTGEIIMYTTGKNGTKRDP